MSTKSDVIELFSNNSYRRILPFVAIVITASIMPIIILPAFGAEWFAHCNDKNQSNEPCVFDYTRYNFYSSLFASINGIVTFIFSGFMGSLSDKYGRKPLIYCCIGLGIINHALMIVYVNLFLYWSLQAVNAIFAIPTIMTAYISDIIPKQSLKTIGYAYLFAFGSIFFLIGSVLGAVIGRDSHYIWITVTALYISLMIYTIFCVKETHYQQTQDVAMETSKSMDKTGWNQDDMNPLKALLFINSNPIILYVSIVNLIIAIPASFFGVLLVYINDELDVNNINQSDMLNMTVFVSMAISSIINAAIILPFIKRYRFATDLNLVIIGVAFVMFGNLVFSTIPYITWYDTVIFKISINDNDDIFLTYFAVVILGSASFSFFTFIGAALNSIVTKYINPNEHGLAFGIMQSMGGITSIFAPFAFGYGYNKSKEIGIPSLMLYIISVLLCLCLVILLFPLRSTIKKLDKTNHVFCLRDNKISDQSSILQTVNNNNDKNVNDYKTFVS